MGRSPARMHRVSPLTPVVFNFFLGQSPYHFHPQISEAARKSGWPHLGIRTPDEPLVDPLVKNLEAHRMG
jgi:hypothetical protein